MDTLYFNIAESMEPNPAVGKNELLRLRTIELLRRALEARGCIVEAAVFNDIEAPELPPVNARYFSRKLIQIGTKLWRH